MSAVHRKYPLNRSVRKEYSIAGYAARASKDSRLHDDVGDFMAKRGGRVDDLVDKLLNGDFTSSRYTD